MNWPIFPWLKQGLARLAAHRLVAERRGTVAVYLAVATVPLIGFVGMAVDTGRGELLKARLNQALDAAALAGGRVFFDANRDADIRAYFTANFPAHYMAAQVSPIAIHADPLTGTLTLSATATLNTTFMQVLGQDSMTVNAKTVVERADHGMELALVLDNTGSMYQGGVPTSRFHRMQNAAIELVNILYGSRDTVANFWVSVVPYTAAVNIGSSRTSWRNSITGLNYQGVATWKGCVEARTGGNDITDATPTTAKFNAFFFAPHNQDNPWKPVDESVATNTTGNEGHGPNLGCGPPITSLVASKTAVMAALNGMGPWHRGGTITSEGLAWGWRTISPNWRGLWGGATPNTLPKDYNTPLIDKVVVILTDGMNELYRDTSRTSDSDYTAYGRLSAGRLGTTTSLTTARQTINSKTLQICSAMKAQGIIIYTITFEVDNSTAGQEGKTTFRNCATSPAHYFDNPVGTDLTTTFRQIATEIGNLRIAQ